MSFLFARLGLYERLVVAPHLAAPLQVYLRELIIRAGDAEQDALSAERLLSTPQESVRGAAVFASTLPIILVYPFLQKYYVKGMTLGAVKG